MFQVAMMLKLLNQLRNLRQFLSPNLHLNLSLNLLLNLGLVMEHINVKHSPRIITLWIVSIENALAGPLRASPETQLPPAYVAAPPPASLSGMTPPTSHTALTQPNAPK